MLSSNLVVAIDGPAGSGKSTVAGLLGQRLNLPLLDTGATYRAAALAVVEAGVALSDEARVVETVKSLDLRLTGDTPNCVFIGEREVTDQLRSLEIGQAASQISTFSEVRRHLVAVQQAILAQGGRILEGRDVTTVVAPNADLKIFLTASIEERARRRWLELLDKGEKHRLQDVVRDVVERDHRDYRREDSPLQLAEDATILETFGHDPIDIVEMIVSFLEARLGSEALR